MQLHIIRCLLIVPSVSMWCGVYNQNEKLAVFEISYTNITQIAPNVLPGPRNVQQIEPGDSVIR